MRRGSGSGRMGRESGTGFCIQTAFLHMRPVVGSLSVFCWAWVRGCLWALVVSAHHSGSAHSISAHSGSAHSVFVHVVSAHSGSAHSVFVHVVSAHSGSAHSVFVHVAIPG